MGTEVTYGGCFVAPLGWKLWPWFGGRNGPEQHRRANESIWQAFGLSWMNLMGLGWMRKWFGGLRLLRYIGWFGFGLGSVDVTALSSTVGHTAKPSNESIAFGLGWIDLMGVGWIDAVTGTKQWSTFETLKSKEMDAETPSRARFRNARTPAGFKPKGLPRSLRTGALPGCSCK